MDSVTRPVGHLPPSVYWRRRGIVLVGLAVLIALVAWACTAGGGGGDDKKNAGAESPAPSGSSGAPAPIGPGPSNPAPGASPGQPGPSGGAGANAGANGGANAGSGPGGTSGGTAPGGTNGGSVPGGAANGGTTGQAPSGQPGASTGAGSSTVGGILACSFPGNAQLILTGDRPQESRYRVGEQVKLTLEIKNNGTQTCAVDMSQRSATVEIKSGSDHIWSPADCAQGQPEITQIQPGKSVTRTWTWSWTRSDANRCTGQAPGLTPPPPGALFAATGKIAGVQWASNPYQWTVAQ